MASNKQKYVDILHTICDWIDPKNENNCLEEGWDGYGAVPLSESVCVIAITLLNKLYQQGFVNDIIDITPSPDGEFSFEWYDNQSHNLDIVVDLQNPDIIKYLWFYSKPNEKRTHGSTNSIEEIYPMISEFAKPERITDAAKTIRSTLTWSDIGNEAKCL